MAMLTIEQSRHYELCRASTLMWKQGSQCLRIEINLAATCVFTCNFRNSVRLQQRA